MSTLASDLFTNSDDTLLTTHNAGWSDLLNVYNGMKIRSNGASYNGNAGNQWTGLTWPSNQWVRAIVGTVLDQHNLLVLRADPTRAAWTAYFAGQYQGNYANTRYRIIKRVAGTITNIWGHASQVMQSGDDVEFGIQGTEFYLKVNGVEITGGGITDADIADGDPGLAGHDNVTTNLVAWDTWSAGDFTGVGGDPFVKVLFRGI